MHKKAAVNHWRCGDSLAGCLAAKTTVSGAMMWRVDALAEGIATPGS